MSNLLTRIKDSISSDINELLDQKEQKNPIAMLNQHLRLCEKEVKRVRDRIDRQYLLKDTFIREYHQAAEMAEKRGRQAEIARQASEQGLQEFALKEKEDYAQKAERIKAALDNCVRQLEQLEEKFADMKRRLKDMYLKRMELMSRENIASANSHMDRVIHPGQAFGQSFSIFEESELYLERLENKVNTEDQHNTIDARIRRIQRELKAKGQTD
ncbi:PspA/IM30 family protein [Sporolactobacillus vineae]|uniref:PspA/IM30 family protein n=1 Tax=Sporolactobacillus vineae TaxID=444463 RepID=UPI0002894011|nr:PspA/IM30 family protein [Sporolactobacillus vineae]